MLRLNQANDKHRDETVDRLAWIYCCYMVHNK